MTIFVKKYYQSICVSKEALKFVLGRIYRHKSIGGTIIGNKTKYDKTKYNETEHNKTK